LGGGAQALICNECNGKILLAGFEFVCENCGIVYREIEENSKENTYKSNFMHEGHITYWNKLFTLGSKPPKLRLKTRIKFLTEREKNIFNFLRNLKENYVISDFELNKLYTEIKSHKKLTKTLKKHITERFEKRRYPIFYS
jgi:predicted RNA-binding Zn-ribbon protein involved in translation (DUF1610 family)